MKSPPPQLTIHILQLTFYNCDCTFCTGGINPRTVTYGTCSFFFSIYFLYFSYPLKGRHNCYSIINMMMVNQKWSSFLKNKVDEWWLKKFSFSFGLSEVFV